MQRPDHIDPLAAARHLGIEVAYGHLVGATARIYRIGRTARIRVSDQIVLAGRRRFSIAHELGHYVLGHTLAVEGRAEAVTACDHRSGDDEREADAFAAELLTPAAMFRPLCEGPPVTLERVRNIGQVFTASPVASALRFVELASEPCAVAYSLSAVVQWVRRSKSFGPTILPGRRVGHGAVAVDPSRDPAPRAVPADAWVASYHLSSCARLLEDAAVVPEPGWGGVLSLLWIPRPRQDHDRPTTDSDDRTRCESGAES